MQDSLESIEKLIGARMRARREQLGLTQSEVGKSIGVSFQQIQKYEKGLNRLAASKLLLLAGALQVSLMFFFTGRLDDPAQRQLLFEDSHVTLLAKQDRDGRRLLMAFAQITCGKNRLKVLTIVEALSAAFVDRESPHAD